MESRKTVGAGKRFQSANEQPTLIERTVLEKEGFRDFKFWRNAPDCADEVTAVLKLEIPLLTHMKQAVFYEALLATNNVRIVCGYDGESNPQKIFDTDPNCLPKRVWDALSIWLHRVSRKGNENPLNTKFSKGTPF